MAGTSSHPGWEEIEHTADWALRVRGEDLRTLFENAAWGMLSMIGGDASPPGAVVHKTFSLRAPDWEILLVDWLTELLYLIEDQQVVFTHIVVHHVADFALEAEVTGRANGHFDKYIKAVTYHNLAIRQTDTGYETVIVFDV
jgi:SHS2 domain-containing protein